MRNLALHRLLGLALLTLVPISSAHAQQAAQAAPLRGDVNGDGRVNAADAQAVRDYVAGRPAQPGTVLLPNGDANGDGRITGVDAAMIQAFAAGRDVSRFGVGQPIRGGGAGDGEAKNGSVLTMYVCTVDVESNTQSCETPRPETGAAADVLLGKPYVGYVTTGSASSRGNSTNEDTTTMNVAVTNNIDQAIGTTDGTNAAPSGIRVYFADGPKVTAVKSGALASATARLEGTDGTADFTGPDAKTRVGKPFYQYNAVLEKGTTSASKLWRFVYTANTKTFTYAVHVSAPVRYENGWVTIAPGALVLGPDTSSAPLAGTPRHFTGETLTDGLTWSSSDQAVATVDASTGVVTGVAPGTATITATSAVKSQRKGSIPVTVDAPPTVESISPADQATKVSSSTNIVITFSEPVDVTTASFSLECPAGTPKAFTVSGSGTATVTLDPTASLPAGTICTVKVNGSQVSDSDTNDGPNHLAGERTFTFEVGITAVDDAFTPVVTGNVRINSAGTSFSVLTNDDINPANTTVTFYGWEGNAGKTQNGGDVTAGAAAGEFIYNPPAGYEGADSLSYIITSGAAADTAKVGLTVGGMIWFIKDSSVACTESSKGCGRLSTPYTTLAAFQTENNGTGNNPAANDNIFLYQKTTPYTGAVTLLNGQKLIGQDASATLSAITTITPAAGSDPLPAMDPAGDAVTITHTDGVNLGTGNTIRGLTLAPTAGEAIAGTSFGTLTLSTGTPDLTINAGGQALLLTTGAITGTFTSVASAGGTNNVFLSGVTGDIDFGNGALSGSTGGAIKIVGGPLTLDASGNITQATAFPLLDVSGHTGALTFTGSLNATAGSGLQFSDADGSYSFGGTTTLNGGDAGIDITTGSTGTFAFASGTAVTNPTGTAFRVAASTPSITYNGNLTKDGASAGLLVDISDQASGTITFANGTLLGTSTNAASNGIQLSNVDGAVSFNGTTTLSGGNNGVDVIGGSTGAISFASTSSITNPSGIALNISNGGVNTNVTFPGNISTNTGRPVHVEGVSAGTVNVTGTIAATGQGLLAQNNTGGTFSFTNATKTLNTGANAAVTLTSNTGATISFTNGLAITTTSGAGINATGGGNLTVQGTTNTISTGTGTALSVANTTIAAGGLNFRSISANGAPNGIVLNNTGSTAGLTVTGDGSTSGSGGTIQNTTGGDGAIAGNGIYLASTRNVSLAFMQINDHQNNGLRGIGVENFTMNRVRFTGANGTNADGPHSESAMFFEQLTGTASITGSYFSGGMSNSVRLSNSSGSLNRITFASDTFAVQVGNPTTRLLNDALLVQGLGTATVNTTIQNSRFQAAGGDLLQYDLGGSAAGDLVLNGTAFSNSHSNVASGGGGVVISAGGGGTATMTYAIANNTFRDASGTALVVSKTSGTGTATGTITGNQIGVSGVGNSGSAQGSGIDIGQVGGGTHTVTITGNTIRQYTNYGILAQVGNNSAANGGQGRIKAVIQSNTVNSPNATPFIGNGIHLQTGLLPSDNLIGCFTIGGSGGLANAVSGTGTNGGSEIRLRAIQSTTFVLPGYGGGKFTASAGYNVNPFVSANNAAAVVTSATNSAGGGGFEGSCPF